jgi:hypothetical protein
MSLFEYEDETEIVIPLPIKNTKRKKETEPKGKSKKITKKDLHNNTKFEECYSLTDDTNFILYASTVCGVKIKNAVQLLAPLTNDIILKFTEVKI